MHRECTPAERERLTKLVEECSEVIKVATKILNHGYDTEFAGVHYNNRADLERELGDVGAATRLMTRRGDIDHRQITKARRAKLPVITKYMRHQ